MATKVLSKVSKSVVKKTPPAKKSSPAPKPATKPVSKKPVAKQPPAKVVAKLVSKLRTPVPSKSKPVGKPMAKPASKSTVPTKKTDAKSTPVKSSPPVKNITPVKKVKTPAKPATLKKEAFKPLAKKVLPAAKASPKDVSPSKMEKVGKAILSSVKKVAERVVEAVTPSAPAKPHKAVIVPSKPAINPKPVPVIKKTEIARSSKPVVIPKTSTNNKVDYNPEFKSVLDKPAQVPSGPTMRYSDAELQQFRELINKKLDAAKKELAYLQGLITRKDEMGGDETDNRYMTMEDGSMSMEREQLSQMASRQITFIDHLEKAIMRIENKTYGICRVSGKLIDKARLRAVPHATLSMEAKLGIVK